MISVRGRGEIAQQQERSDVFKSRLICSFPRRQHIQEDGKKRGAYEMR
jgi:hypothetical protein